MKPYFAFQWHITDYCDQRCKHCYIFSEGKCSELISMSFENMKRVISNIEDMCERLNRTPYFYITGGDPILHPDFWELMELMKQKGYKFTIMGNPFHLTDEVCRRLKECGCEKYQIPKYAQKDMVYEGCYCGICHMTILPNGDVYACRRFESKVGNVFQDALYDIFITREEIYRDYDKFEKCSKCELRGFCRGCPAVTYGTTGNFYGADPQCWKVVEEAEREELQAVLDAGMYAPSAGGRQDVLFVVSQNREKNEKLGRIKRNNSTVKMSTDTVYISKEQPSIADDPDIFNAFYDAPTVITLFVPKNFLFGPYDASAAAENMLLAAHSIGLGGCYIGSAWESFADPYGQEVLREWNIRTDHQGELNPQNEWERTFPVQADISRKG